jgi:hypothetical protein
MDAPVHVLLDAPAASYAVQQFDPRTGLWTDLGLREGTSSYTCRPPDAEDWVVVLRSPSPRQ